MAAGFGSVTSMDFVDNLHGVLQKKNAKIMRVFQVNMFGLNRRDHSSRSFGLKGKSGNPSSDLYLEGKGINGSARVGEPLKLGLEKGDVVNEEDDNPLHACMLGRFVEGKFVYRQAFVIRSYEIGPDKTATMETLMNLLQETALNHVTSSGLAGNGFGATREMSLRKLIWVVTRVHVQVDKYSSWGDVVEIDTWVDAAGKNGMRRDWIIRDYATQQIITRATSTWVTMNRETRKLSKIPDEVRKEVEPFYLNRHVLQNGDHDDDDNNNNTNNSAQKINKLTDQTADIIRSGLAPRWNDMDANQHVNNVKYIGWILESVPTYILQDYDMTSMTLEYRRECRQANVIESLTSTKMNPPPVSTCPSPATTVSVDPNTKFGSDIENTHLLRLEGNKAEIVRARTKWHPKAKLDIL